MQKKVLFFLWRCEQNKPHRKNTYEKRRGENWNNSKIYQHSPTCPCKETGKTEKENAGEKMQQHTGRFNVTIKKEMVACWFTPIQKKFPEK